MIKLYICYFVFGGLIAFYSLIASYFPPEGMRVLTNLALYSSVILYLIIPGFVLYKLKYGAIVGLILTVCVLPFSSYWLWYRFVQHGFISGGPEDVTIYMMAALLIINIVYSIKHARSANPEVSQIKIKKPIKIILALLPAILIGGDMGWFYLSKLIS